MGARHGQSLNPGSNDLESSAITTDFEADTQTFFSNMLSLLLHSKPDVDVHIP